MDYEFSFLCCVLRENEPVSSILLYGNFIALILGSGGIIRRIINLNEDK